MPSTSPSVLSIPLTEPAARTPELLWWRGRPRLSGLLGEAALSNVLAARDMAATKAALARLDGGFAAVWRSGFGKILMATDRFAIEPLCWRLLDNRVVIASRADELADLEPSAAVDPVALFDFLYFHVIPSPRTAFSGVARLSASHAATVHAGAVEAWRYWTPAFEPPATRPEVPPLAATLRSLLLDATRDAASALQGSVGCYLSGGTDSSTVAGMLSKASGATVDAFSIGFEAAGYDEMAYARVAARHFGCRHHEHYVTTAELTEHLPRVAAHFDQPFGNSSALPAFLCATMAQGSGTSALLAGDGGDELFGGNARYAKQRLFSLYGRIPSPVRKGLLEPVLMRTGLGSLPGLRKAKSYVEQARLPMPARAELYNLLLRTGLDTVLEPGFRELVHERGPLEQQQRVWGECEAETELDRTLAFDWRYTLAECDLPKVVESARMASVSVGFPLLDRRLLDFSMRLPNEYKLRGQQLRWFFKEALDGFLPREIIEKQKHGFGLPFGVWCLQDRELKSLATDCLHSLGNRGIVRQRFTADLINHRLPQHPGYYGEFVWILCALELWLRAHRPDTAMR